ncbi:hypothetical protein [Caballeronia sp. GAFFF3]|uniref:hypothetical protein n=1 Tax=Caballeronia sp. GAFFF3 TaxID=2921759 RepID=UPI002027CC3B|nr:hypothetical protein [Caballeronia sp. GAFFF3]
MKDDQFKGLPDDMDEWIRLLQSDDGRAAREHLEAGRAIYYRDADTPIGLCIKKYPDGHRELVRFSVEHGEKFVSSLPPCVRLGLLDGKLDVRHDFNDPLPADLLDLFESVAKSTKAANDALDDALAFIDESNVRIERLTKAE